VQTTYVINSQLTGVQKTYLLIISNFLIILLHVSLGFERTPFRNITFAAGRERGLFDFRDSCSTLDFLSANTAVSTDLPLFVSLTTPETSLKEAVYCKELRREVNIA
jgi:hypothetical protein